MATVDRALAILALFSADKPNWTVDEVAAELGFAGSSAYKYVSSLVRAGLLATVEPGRYSIGPAITEYDRLMRRSDPLIGAAAAELAGLTSRLPAEGIALLCRAYKSSVMCVDQVAKGVSAVVTSYERGRPMPLFRGAHSKAILANLDPRILRRLYDGGCEEISNAGLGHTWKAFRKSLLMLRKEEVVVTRGELDVGAVGIASPIFGPAGSAIGSIGLVTWGNLLEEIETLRRIKDDVLESGRRVSAALAPSTNAK